MNRQNRNYRNMLGRKSEELAVQHLIECGYLLVERNWRCRSGEIDIIVKKDDQLVFVEVRSRKFADHFGHPIESVVIQKQIQVRKIARIYLAITGVNEQIFRFDVIAIKWHKDQLQHELTHVINAF